MYKEESMIVKEKLYAEEGKLVDMEKKARNMWGKVDDLTNNVRTLRKQAFEAEKAYALDPRNEKKNMPQ